RGHGRFRRRHAGRRRRARQSGRRAARPVEGDHRAGRADPAVRAARADADPASHGLVRDTRDMSAPAATPPLALPRGARAVRARRVGLWLAAAVLLLILPQLVRTGTALAIMNQMGIAVIFALSFNMLLGQGGMLSFGHAVYFGIGGFIAAHVLNLAGRGALWLPVPLLPLIGGLRGPPVPGLFGSFSPPRPRPAVFMIFPRRAALIGAASPILRPFFCAP